MLKENKIKQDIVFLKNFNILKFGENRLKKFLSSHKKIFGAAAVLGTTSAILYHRNKKNKKLTEQHKLASHIPNPSTPNLPLPKLPPPLPSSTPVPIYKEIEPI